MTVLRGLTILGLCLFMALTSVTLAVARGAPQPVGVMVLCTGDGARQVHVDTRGQPVASQHACPDCLLAFHAVAARDPVPARHAVLRPARHGTAVTRHAAAAQPPMRLARAPPRPV